MLRKAIDINEVHSYYSLIFNKTITDITTIESLESANQQRLFALMSSVEENPVFVIKRVLMMNLMWLMTPGIVAFTQGSEFVAKTPMQDKAGPLDIAENVGVVQNEAFVAKGSHWGIFEMIRKMVLFRRLYRLYDRYRCSLVYKDERQNVIAFSIDVEATPIILVMNLSPMDYSEKP